MTARKGTVTTVNWPADGDAEARVEALRSRDREIGELVASVDRDARIGELEKQVRILRILSMVQKSRNPWWFYAQVRTIAVKVIKRLIGKR